MLFDNKIFIVHSPNSVCNGSGLLQTNNLDTQLSEFISDLKKKRIIKGITHVIKPYLNEDLIIILPKSNSFMHLSDFVAILQNPLPRSKLNPKQMRFLKNLKALNVSFPSTCILNKFVRKILV